MELRTYNKSNSQTQQSKIISAKSEKPAHKKASTNIHKDHRTRLKSKFVEHGIEPLTDVQKLELLLFYAIPQKDTNPLSHKLISTFGSLKDVFNADYNDLIKIDGVKENTATLIRFFGSMLNYSSRPDGEELLTSSSKAKEYVKKII